MLVNGLVVVDVPPTASFTASPTPQLRGQAVNFDGSAATSPGGSITAYNWDFGDGGGRDTAPAEHARLHDRRHLHGHADRHRRPRQRRASQQDVDITVPDSDGDGINDDNDKCASDAGPGAGRLPDRAAAVIPAPIASSATAAGDLGVTARSSRA